MQTIGLSGAGFLVFLMIEFAAIMSLIPAPDCLGNWCKWELHCLHQFPPVCVWPSKEGSPLLVAGGGCFLVYLEDFEVLVPRSLGRSHFLWTRVMVLRLHPA